MPNHHAAVLLAASGINRQILIGEDVDLDSKIQSEDPSNELVLGFANALQTESTSGWPFLCLPFVGENRMSQLQKALDDQLRDSPEVCLYSPTHRGIRVEGTDW